MSYVFRHPLFLHLHFPCLKGHKGSVHFSGSAHISFEEGRWNVMTPTREGGSGGADGGRWDCIVTDAEECLRGRGARRRVAKERVC